MNGREPYCGMEVTIHANMRNCFQPATPYLQPVLPVCYASFLCQPQGMAHAAAFSTL